MIDPAAPANYVGRFAPSPSGPLHFGSLVTALGSFLQAKKNAGKWLVRIEDIDPPREVQGAADAILACLSAHHLHWDGEVLYQSQRSALYQNKIQYLQDQGYTYNCVCTRAQLASLAQTNLCDCARTKLSHTQQPAAIRFKHQAAEMSFHDQLLGKVTFSAKHIANQFAIQRKDGLFAYQLAVVVDDIAQGITEVARGADLLDATLYQLALYKAFARPAPKFLHFPVVVTAPGKKLSKQNHATKVSNHTVSSNLFYAIQFLGLQPPTKLKSASPAHIIDWARTAWDLSLLSAQRERIDNRIGQPDSI